MPELQADDFEIARRDMAALIASIPEEEQERLTAREASLGEAMKLMATWGWIDIVELREEDGYFEYKVTDAGKAIVRQALV